MLAVVCALGWGLGAWLARWYGIWGALGTAGVTLGIVSLIVDRAELLGLLRRPATLPWGVLIGALMTAATYAIYPHLARSVPMLLHDGDRLYGAFVSMPPTEAALLLLPIIASEELVWRGVVQGALMRRVGPTAGTAIAIVLYAAAHAPAGSPLLVVAALACGVVWAGLRLATSGLLAPLAAHLVWDFAVLLVHPVVPKA